MYSAATHRPRRRILAICVAIILVVLIVLAVVIVPRVRSHEQFLTGMWYADPAFLKSSDLSDMFLYVAPPDAETGAGRQGYLVMTNTNGDLISNQGVGISYTCQAPQCWSALKSHLGKVPYQVPNFDIDYDDTQVMPTRMHMDLDMTQGSLTLFDDEKVYAFLVKDNETSMVANELYGS